MRALLDVNVWIALFDADHVFHDRAHEWFAGNLGAGFATCPITENGVVRILSNPRYSKAFQLTPGDVIERLDRFCSSHDHRFWADEISLRDPALFHRGNLVGPRQLTDLYLLALAKLRGGCLVTFDQAIPLNPVPGVDPAHLKVI